MNSPHSQPATPASVQSPGGLNLPEPDAQLLAHSQELVDCIRAAIVQAGGWISFERYMQLALYEPGLGYYAAGLPKLGKHGDFTTAPEISSLFGLTLAQQVLEICHYSAYEVLEFGAGSGALACDVLLACEHAGHPLQRYCILEVSADLRERQRETLAQRAPQLLDRVQWLNQLPQQWTGCILGNEVLDAMPVRLWHQDAQGIHERGVTVDAAQQLVLTDRVAEQSLISAVRARVPAGFAPYTSEWAEQAQGFIASLADCLTQGGILMVDYGYTKEEYYHPQRTNGTLMCHYQHRAHDNALLWPGLQDITAHVDFSTIAHTAQAHGLQLSGYTSQTNFLMNAGLPNVLQQLHETDPQRWPQYVEVARKLMTELHMGELFKAILLTRQLPTDFVPCGFTRGDRSGSLLES